MEFIMNELSYDLIVIGAGPGGYVGAIRAAQLGLKVAVIEKEKLMGGTCLRVGCIPSKALLESSHNYHAAKHQFSDHGIAVQGLTIDVAAMLKRKQKIVTVLGKGIESLFKKNAITRYTGTGRFVGETTENGHVIAVANNEGETRLTGKSIIIATGSVSSPLRGITVDETHVLTSTGALEIDQVPKTMAVIGAGAIGLEMASVWSRLGTEVTVLEYMDKVLPTMDQDISKNMQKILKDQGINFQLGVKVTKAEKHPEGGCVVEIDGKEALRPEKVLLAVGRAANTEGLRLDTLGITCDARGRIPVDTHFSTTARDVYAIGDVIEGPMLAHKAEEDGVACAEWIATGHGHVDYNIVPMVVYTDPEAAAVGKTEQQLKDTNIPYKVGMFPFMANGRARTYGDTSGFVKMLAHADTDRILGVHIVGKHAGDLIAEAASAMAFHASSEDIARVCHAHPTLAEAIKEAAMAVDGRAIHA